METLYVIVVVVVIAVVALGGGIRISTGDINILSKREDGHQKNKP